MEDRAIYPFLKPHFDLCTGCTICQLACSERIAGGFNPRRSVLRIVHSQENLVHEPFVCEQCTNPICGRVCPVQAISRDEATGVVHVDHDVCIGCGTCAAHCPLGVIHVSPDLKKAVKCDLCQGDPLCVKACPTGALESLGRGGDHA